MSFGFNLMVYIVVKVDFLQKVMVIKFDLEVLPDEKSDVVTILGQHFHGHKLNWLAHLPVVELVADSLGGRIKPPHLKHVLLPLILLISSPEHTNPIRLPISLDINEEHV